MRFIRYCRWARRGFLPAFVLLLVLSALPASSGMFDRAAWRTPMAQRQFRQWSEILSRVGLDVSPRKLESTTWRTLRVYRSVRTALRWPIHAVSEQLGLSQSWTLFAVPQTDPCRLVIEVETEQGWRTLYASRSAAHTWRRASFDQHRVRKWLGRMCRTENQRNWKALGSWLQRTLPEDEPAARTVRVSLWRWRTPKPHSNEKLPPLSERGELVRSSLLPLSEGT